MIFFINKWISSVCRKRVDIEAARVKQGGVDVSSMRIFAVNLKKNPLPSGGKCVVFCYSPGKRGKVVINGVKQGGVDVV